MLELYEVSMEKSPSSVFVRLASRDYHPTVDLIFKLYGTSKGLFENDVYLKSTVKIQIRNSFLLGKRIFGQVKIEGCQTNLTLQHVT